MAVEVFNDVTENPHGVERLRVCSPGFVGPENLDVVRASDYDALLAMIDDPYFPVKHARRLIAELRGKVADLEAERARIDHIEKSWFVERHGSIQYKNPLFFGGPKTLREAIDQDIRSSQVVG